MLYLASFCILPSPRGASVFVPQRKKAGRGLVPITDTDRKLLFALPHVLSAARVIEACKARKPAGSDFSYGGPLTELALLGVIAMRFKGQTLQWDSARMRFTNCSEANAYLKPSFRKGWGL